VADTTSLSFSNQRVPAFGSEADLRNVNIQASDCFYCLRLHFSTISKTPTILTAQIVRIELEEEVKRLLVQQFISSQGLKQCWSLSVPWENLSKYHLPNFWRKSTKAFTAEGRWIHHSSVLSIDWAGTRASHHVPKDILGSRSVFDANY
jgi:hypothetical protein